MTNLKHVDFKAVAKRGCFVYAYLRHSDSYTASAYTPYYIGISTSSTVHNRRWRPWARHPDQAIPEDERYVVVLKSGLTEKQAQDWEKFYIFWYGLKSEGGILANKNYGGGSNAGFRQSDDQKKRHSERMRGNQYTKGRKLDPDHVEVLRRNGKRVDHIARGRDSGIARAKTAAAKYGICFAIYITLSRKIKCVLCSRWSRGKRGAELLAGLAI
jgi:hypothetical protein